MDRRRAAGLLLALAACFATATAAPTTSNHTALDIYDGSPDGCYYNFQHYGEGDRIMTNEPCLNCTCHNRMLMCYLRVCPFTKPIGQDCTVEKRADQCCPIVTCPDVPVDLLTSTTTSPAEYGPTGMGKLDKFGCSINGKYFSEGSKVPPTPNKPCEHCYCIRNMTTCVMQECTLHVDGCTPIYHKDVCCPVRYSCDHPEDEMPLLDDLSTTVRPTPGFLLTTTTVSPVTQISQDCVYDNRIFPDGALIKTEKACDHCYCMKGDIVCVVQECGTPMENEGKNCTALPPREGVCCPDTYICEGDEMSTTTYEPENLTTLEVEEKLTTLSPPRRTSSEGSGYRIEPDDALYTERPEIIPDIEGSGEEDERKPVSEITTDTTRPADEILASTEETHEYFPLTTTKSKEEFIPEATTSNKNIFDVDVDGTTEAQEQLSSTSSHSANDFEEPITDKNTIGDLGSGEMPVDDTPKDYISSGSVVPTTDIIEQYTASPSIPDHDSSVPQMPTTSAPIIDEEMTMKPIIEDSGSSDESNQKPISPVESDITTALPDESTKMPDLIESSQTDTKDIEPLSQTTVPSQVLDETTKATKEYVDQSAVTNTPKDLEMQQYPSSTIAASDDEYVTTEYSELITDERNETEHSEPPHVTASTPMLEEIEKETTGFSEPEGIATTGASQDGGLSIFDTTPTNVLVKEDGKTDLPAVDFSETTKHPIFDGQDISEKTTESTVDISVHEDVDKYLPSTPSEVSDTERKTTSSEYHEKPEDYDTTTPTSSLVKEEATTEPDKGLNTIPSDAIDEQVSVSPETQKTTVEEEKTPEEADLENKFGSEKEKPILSSPTPQEELSTVTTESAFRKEDFSPTEADIGVKSSTEKKGAVTEKIASTFAHEYIESTESNSDMQRQTDTTLKPELTESTEETILDKTTSIDSAFDTTPKSSVESLTEKYTTSVPSYEKETTIANQEDNEIFNEPRIPGEGDCLLNGVTYSNDSAVPSSHKCQSGCKCVSSIIKCDPIICSPPPEYMHNMDNCETTYDTPDACCPTYICEHKTETIPAQSHSQMSGTESPVISPEPCQGDACETSTEKAHQILPTEDCKSGSCLGPSDESKVEIPDKSLTDKKYGCSEESGCQALPVQPCEGEKCGTVLDIASPPKAVPCAPGEDCKDPNIATGACAGSDCDIGATDMQSSYPTEICSEKEGCTSVPKLPEELCKDDKCRRKETSPLDQHVPEPCKGPDCKHSESDAESSTTSSLQQSSQHGEELDKKMTTIDFLEKMETSKSPEIPDLTTNLPADEIKTTVSDDLKPISDEIETTTKLSDFFNIQEHVSTENNELHRTELPEYHLPVSTEIVGSDIEATTQEVISLTTEKIETEAYNLPKVTEPAQTDNSEEPKPFTETIAEIQPEDQTEIYEITKPEVVVKEPTDELKPSNESDGNENITDNILEVATDLPKLQEDINKSDSTQPPIEDSNTELSVTNTTPSHEVTKVSDTTHQEELVTVTPESVSDHDMTVTGKVTDLSDSTKSPAEISSFDTSTTSAVEVPNVTRKDSEDDSTAKGSEEPIASSESPENISTIGIEASTVEPSKTAITEKSDIPKISESFGTKTPDTTEKVSDKFGTEPTVEFYGTTLPQDVEITTSQFEENTLVPSQTEGAPQSDNKYPNEIEHGIPESSSEFKDSYVTTPKSFDDHKTTTYILSEKSTTQPPKYESEDQVTTEYPKESDITYSSPHIPESSSETSVTHHKTPDQDEANESDVSIKPDDKPVEPHDDQEGEKLPIEKDHDIVTEIFEELTTEPSRLFDMNTDKLGLPDDGKQETATVENVQPTEQTLPIVTESHDMSKLPEEAALTETPESDSKLPGAGEPELNSVTEEITTQQAIGSTTILSLYDSKTTTSQEDTKITTESSSGEITTPIDHHRPSTAVTESDLLEQETENPRVDDQTLTSLSPDSDVSKPDTTEQPEKTSEKDISQDIDTEKSEDELRTTALDIHELTTLNPTEITKSSQDTDKKSDRPEINYTQYEEQSTQKSTTVSRTDSTDKMLTDTETEMPSLMSSEKPSQLDTNVVEQSETGASQATLDDQITTEKSYTEEKYSSTEPPNGTDQPAFEDKKPLKPEDSLIQSLVTEKYDEQTKPVIIEEDSHTQIPIQFSLSPDDVKTTLQQKDDRDKLLTTSSTPSLSTDTTHKEYNDELVPTSDSIKPSEEEIHTEKPSTDDFIKNTTQKEVEPEGNEVTQDYSVTEPVEITTSATPIHKITEHSEEPVEPTEEIVFETSLTEKPDKLPTKTEMSLSTQPSDAKPTEPVHDVTKPSDIQAQTEQSETPEPIESEKQDADENISATSASIEKEFELTTLRPSAETATSLFDSTEGKPLESYTEKVLELTTAFPDKTTSIDDLATTGKEMLPDISETTISALEDTDNIVAKPEKEQKPQAEEQLTPIATQTERIIPASEKPLRETIAPEEEFIVATSKTTAVQAEGTTMAPAAEITTSNADSEHSPSTIGIEETVTSSEAIVTAAPKVTEKFPAVPVSSEPETLVTQSPDIEEHEQSQTTVTAAPEQSVTSVPKQQEIASEESISNMPVLPSTPASETVPEESNKPIPEAPITIVPETSVTDASDALVTSSPDFDASTTTKELHPSAPELPEKAPTESPITNAPELTVDTLSEAFITIAPEVVPSSEPDITFTNAPEIPNTEKPEVPFTNAAELLPSVVPKLPSSLSTEAPELPPVSTEALELPKPVTTEEPEIPTPVSPEAPEVPTPVSDEAPELPKPVSTETPESPKPESTEEAEVPTPVSAEAPEVPTPVSDEAPELPKPVSTETPESPKPESTEEAEIPTPVSPEAPEVPTPVSDEAPELPKPVSTETPESPKPESTEEAEVPTPVSAEAPEVPTPVSTEAPEVPTPVSTETPELPKPESTAEADVPTPASTEAPELPTAVSTEAPEPPRPVSTGVQPTDDTLTPDEESFPTSGGTSGYGQEPDYVEEDQQFGPGTCRYGGKVYVSAQQIPRDDPCDFCFCFRSDIICLQQSCPPPIHGCHEEPIQGFCCPRYECPVSMATTVNVTTTTTTTTTTLPPHFPTHSYKGSVQKRGCQIKGQTYKVGEVVRSSSGPCLHCTCGGDGQMKCDPKVCTPEPMLRQMIAAAVSAKRRR